MLCNNDAMFKVLTFIYSKADACHAMCGCSKQSPLVVCKAFHVYSL